MDNQNNSKYDKITFSQKIPLFPLNGRSSYLIDKFYIFGYDYATLKKYLWNEENINNIVNSLDKKQNKIISGECEFQKFQINEVPTLINEITSDYDKECLDIDMIKEMIIPKSINLFYLEQEKSNEKIKNKGINDLDNPKEKKENIFCIYDESDAYYNKEIKNLSYNVIFSSNPQSGNNSKKSINGFAFIFYKKLKEEKIYLNKYYSFIIPIIFCIISEFPYYNSFFHLCNQIESLFSSYELRMPLEIVLHNIVNLIPSPLNSDVYLSLKPATDMTITSKLTYENILNENLEDSSSSDDFEEKNTKINNEENSNIFNNFNIMGRMSYNPHDSISNKSLNKYNDINNSQKSKVFSSDKFDSKKRNRRTVVVKKHSSIVNGQEISRRTGVSNVLNQIKRSSLKLLGSIISMPNSDLFKKIKFDYLTGYPIIQYNLAKVLLHSLSPADIIVIFLYSFLEKDIIFFSKCLEYLSLTINSYLNLNFPLNDEKYYFINACVSYDNYINGNSTFVGSTFTTIIGINDSYNPKYKSGMNKLKEHLAVDLDNGKIYKVEDKNDKEKSKNNKELFSFIKNICKNRESKEEKSILYREVNILNNLLSDINSNDDKNIYFNMYKPHSYISYNNEIKNLNLILQDAFYRFINNISLYFYQNLSIKTEADDLKIKSKDKNKDTEEEMNVIFLDQYKDDDTYSKEELYLLEELRDTMKFESFVFGFVQSYNPIDLYKIPLTFTEEFMSIIARKNSILDKKINFLSLIDKLYGVGSQQEIYFDLNAIIEDYYTNFKKYFDREIEDIWEKNYMRPENIKIKIYNSYKKIIKYKGYELDDILLTKYLYMINENKENLYFSFLKNTKNNIPKTISLTDIESVIENYSLETNILSDNDLCCANIIILFTLSLRSLNSLMDYQPFLGTLLQSFIVFRKYYCMIISMIYILFEESLEKKEYSRAKDYFYLYYLCINSFRNFKLIPNESLMNIIKKFNKFNIDSLSEDKTSSDKDTKFEENKLYGAHLPEDDITTKNLYLMYNFSSVKTYNEKQIIKFVNDPNNAGDFLLNINENEYITPKIKFNNEFEPHQSIFYSQKILLSTLVEDYNRYIIDLNEDNLRLKIILDACLNIFIFMRNSSKFKDNSDIIYGVKNIFYIFLNKLKIRKKIEEIS